MTSNRRPNLRVARPAHELNKPTPGCYRTRRERGGPWLPALVWFEKARDPDTGAVLDRPPVLQCMIDGERADLERVWNHLHPVDEATYRLMAEDRLDPEAVPDFGQDTGRNSRDAQLEAAAEAALDMELAAVGPQWFRRVALLVAQITECEHDLEAVYRAVARPLQEQLAALREEYHSAAGELKPVLRAALTAYAEEHGIVSCPEVAAFWRTMDEIVIEDLDALPREFLQPNMVAIKAAVAAGRTVPGVVINTKRGIVIS